MAAEPLAVFIIGTVIKHYFSRRNPPFVERIRLPDTHKSLLRGIEATRLVTSPGPIRINPNIAVL
jgi:hypothetical protein